LFISPAKFPKLIRGYP